MLGEAYRRVRVHLWSFTLCILVTKQEGKKDNKISIFRLLINMMGISQQSAETIEAGWAYQELYEIGGFDQHLIAARLFGSLAHPLLYPGGGKGCRSQPCAPVADSMSVRWAGGTQGHL